MGRRKGHAKPPRRKGTSEEFDYERNGKGLSADDAGGRRYAAGMRGGAVGTCAVASANGERAAVEPLTDWRRCRWVSRGGRTCTGRPIPSTWAIFFG
jgi:hypothetical protein